MPLLNFFNQVCQHSRVEQATRFNAGRTRDATVCGPTGAAHFRERIIALFSFGYRDRFLTNSN
jgi:hypothetical protein